MAAGYRKLCSGVVFLEKRKRESRKAVYDLLIVLDDHDTLTEDTAELLAKRMNGPDTTTTILVHRFSFIKNELENGNFFLSWIHRAAIVLVNKNNAFIKLPAQQKKTITAAMFPETRLVVKQELDSAKRFLTGAGIKIEEQQYIEALSKIRQSVACGLKALMLAGLGYAIPTQNMEKMIEVSANFSGIFESLFPGGSKEE